MANATYSQNDSLGGAPDYARSDRIWQRVAPALDPYPQVRAANQKAVPAMAMTMQQSAAVGETEQTVQNRYTAPGGQTEGQTAASVTQTGGTDASVEAQLQLPGASADPCCMGSEAQDLTMVVEGFAQEEAADAASYTQLARLAPGRNQAMALRQMGRDAQRRAQELAAAYYLITGAPLQYGAASVVLPRLPYRELLRRSYHAAACNGLNYARAADATMDICLQRLLQRFSNESYAAADRLLLLLSQLS